MRASLRGAVLCVVACLALPSAQAWVSSSSGNAHVFGAHRTLLKQARRMQLYATSTSDFKNGLTLVIDNAPVKIIEFMHVKPGKGAAFVRTKLKNLVSGNTLEKTFRAGESVDIANVEKCTLQYTYSDDNNYWFMNTMTFEEERIPKGNVGAKSKYLKDGLEITVVKWNDNVIDCEIPSSMVLTVIECDPSVKGNTVTGATKTAIVETGAVIQVPLFIEQGEKIIVNTDEDKYSSRA